MRNGGMSARSDNVLRMRIVMPWSTSRRLDSRRVVFDGGHPYRMNEPRPRCESPVTPGAGSRSSAGNRTVRKARAGADGSRTPGAGRSPREIAPGIAQRIRLRPRGRIDPVADINRGGRLLAWSKALAEPAGCGFPRHVRQAAWCSTDAAPRLNTDRLLRSRPRQSGGQTVIMYVCSRRLLGLTGKERRVAKPSWPHRCGICPDRRHECGEVSDVGSLHMAPYRPRERSFQLGSFVTRRF